MNKPNILFDLDGTLLDTAQDFITVINVMREQKNKLPLKFEDFRKHAYGESNTMVSFGFDMPIDHPEFSSLKTEFLNLYKHHNTKKTRYFSGMPTVLNYLDSHHIPWGIVTNKPAVLMESITTHFNFDKRARCIVAGDTLSKQKPDPAPLLHACKLAQLDPENTIYVGDMNTDVIAARAAGMKSVAVTYGYHKPGDDPADWAADFTVQSPMDILMIFQNLK